MPPQTEPICAFICRCPTEAWLWRRTDKRWVDKMKHFHPQQTLTSLLPPQSPPHLPPLPRLAAQTLQYYCAASQYLSSRCYFREWNLLPERRTIFTGGERTEFFTAGWGDVTGCDNPPPAPALPLPSIHLYLWGWSSILYIVLFQNPMFFKIIE